MEVGFLPHGEGFALQLLLEALGACCMSVPYLRNLLQAALARQILPRSIAFIIKTNVFCHPFYPGMKALIEITLLPALPWWATLPSAHPHPKAMR